MKQLQKCLSLILVFCFAVITLNAWSMQVSQGTVVPLTLQQTVSSATAHVGDQVLLTVNDDVKVNNQVIIAKGAQALATVDKVTPKRGLGRSGELDIQGLYVTAIDNKNLKIRFQQNKTEGGRGGLVWTLGIAVTPWLLFMKGHDAVMKSGANVTAYLDQDADVTTAAETVALQPRLTVANGETQIIRTGTALLKATVENAANLADLKINGQDVPFQKGSLVQVSIPVAMDTPEKAIPVVAEFQDNTSLQQNVAVTQDYFHLWAGKIIQSDTDGTFINLGTKDGLTKDTCFTVYTMKAISNETGAPVETVQNPKGYVVVTDVFDSTAKVAPVDPNTPLTLKPGDLIK